MSPAGRQSRGQSLVEFALVAPILLLLLLGMAEFGRAWMTRNILTGAAREAVRIAAVQGDTAAATARATDILNSAGISVGAGGAAISVLPDNTAFGTCTVTVTYQFQTVVTMLVPWLGDVTLSSATSMRKEY